MRHTLHIALGLALLAGCATLPDGPYATNTAATRGVVAGHIDVMKGRRDGDGSGIVVYLQGVREDLPDMTNVVHEIRQVEKTFVPEVSVVLEGTTVSFPNDDRVFHNVFSVSKARRFDLGLYKAGTTRTVVMKREGVVDVYCNIHPNMAAKVLVLDTTYYAITDKSGDFQIRSVPPGTYRWVAWQPWGSPKKGKVTVTAGEVATVTAELKGGQKPRHTRKDGTLYERYQ